MEKKMIAILLENVDYRFHERHCGLNARSGQTMCNPNWQDVEGKKEIRVVLDDKLDLDPFKNHPSCKVLEGEGAIQAAITALNDEKPETVAIISGMEGLMVESIKQKNIDISDIDPDIDHQEMLRELNKRGALGIKVHKRNTELEVLPVEAVKKMKGLLNKVSAV